MNKPELVVPSPNEAVAKLALSTGADAVHLPITGHVAIRFACDFFSIDEIPPLTQFAHGLGKRVFMVANAFPSLDQEEEYKKLVLRGIDAGVDGIVLGSIGLIRWASEEKIKRNYNGSIIASGVVSAISPVSPSFLASIGVDRVIAPRLLTLNELGEYVSNSEIECEVYTHGFLCAAWDGKICDLPASVFGEHIEKGACIINPDNLSKTGPNLCLADGSILQKELPIEVDGSGENLSFSGSKQMLSACFCDFDIPVDAGLAPFNFGRKTLQSEFYSVPSLIDAGVAGLKVIPEGGGEENIVNTVRIWREVIDSYIESPTEWHVRQEWADWFLGQYKNVVFDATLRRDYT